MRRAIVILIVVGVVISRLSGVEVELRDPANVVVVANANEGESLKLARYYMEARGIPVENLIKLRCETRETISWHDFVTTVHNPLLKILEKRGWLRTAPRETDAGGGRPAVEVEWHRIGYLVLCRGVPLRVRHNGDLVEEAMNLGKAFGTTRSSVDSELAAILEVGSRVPGYLPNPFFNDVRGERNHSLKAVRVCRLDGPDLADAKRLVDHAIAVEAIGLRGRAYVDPGGKHPTGDQWLAETEKQLKALGFDTSVKKSRARFSILDRFDNPVFYFGWYTGDVDPVFLQEGFAFAPGAIGFHIHSFSAATVRSTTRKWVGPLVDRGITATVGNVYEPYLELTHLPQMMLASLASGKTWGEAAYFSLPVLSWQSVVIGDPLYEPFRTRLDKQLERGPDLMDPLQEYVILRFLNLLDLQGRGGEGLEAGKRWFDQQPGIALALRLLELAEAEERLEDEALLLGALGLFTAYPVEDFGLALEAVRSLRRKGMEGQAIDLITGLLKAEKIPALREKELLREGRELAEATGHMTLYAEWGERLEVLESEESSG